MSLLTVVQDVCAFVGVNRPQSVFAGINSDRTQQEMLALANETAQVIAYDEREWTELRKWQILVGDGINTSFNLPLDYRRMLLQSQVWRSTSAVQPMTFYPDLDEWLQRRAYGYVNAFGEWTINGGQIHIWPIMSGRVVDPPAADWQNNHFYVPGDRAHDVNQDTWWGCLVSHTSASSGTFAADRAAHPSNWITYVPTVITPAMTARFTYLDKNCINIPGTYHHEFLNDDDTFRLDERLLKLGMIWRWKQSKGSPYAEDMSNYEIALARVAGSDEPAPIISGRLPISSAARVAIPWPSNWGPQP